MKKAEHFFKQLPGHTEDKFDFLDMVVDWDLGRIPTNYDIVVGGKYMDGGYKQSGEQTILKQKVYQIAEKLLTRGYIKRYYIYLENIGKKPN
jgi:hypothetical protein